MVSSTDGDLLCCAWVVAQVTALLYCSTYTLECVF
jgi:hypothetical protein